MIFSRFFRYFDEVSRHGSIRSAADKIHIASSAINRQILKAEEELGVPLFERMPQGLRLTPAGEALIRHIRRWQREYEQARAEIDQLQGLRGGRVTLAVAESLVGDLLSAEIAEFRRTYPRVEITLMVPPDSASDIVLAGDADVALTFRAVSHRALRVERSIPLHFGVLVPPDHPLAACERVRVQDWLDYPLVLLAEQTMLRANLNIGLARLGLEVRAHIEVDNFEMLRSLLRSGAGVGFTTRADATDDLMKGTLVFRPLNNVSIPPMFLSLITSSQPSSIASQLTQQLGAMLGQLEYQGSEG